MKNSVSISKGCPQAMNQKHSTTSHIIVKFQNAKNQQKMLKVSKGNKSGHLQRYKNKTGTIFFFLFYCCSVTVVPTSPHPTVALPCPIQPLLPKTIPTLLSLPIGLLHMLPFFPPLSPSLLWSLLVCSLFPCLWFLFVCFVDYVPLIDEIIFHQHYRMPEDN